MSLFIIQIVSRYQRQSRPNVVHLHCGTHGQVSLPLSAQNDDFLCQVVEVGTEEIASEVDLTAHTAEFSFHISFSDIKIIFTARVPHIDGIAGVQTESLADP